MGKGLSRKQKTILGIGYSVNQLSGGKAKGIPNPKWSVDWLEHNGIPDFKWPLLSHIIDGSPFYFDPDSGAKLFHYDSKLKSSKASILRCLKSLRQRGLITYCDSTNRNKPWGFVLTQQGLEIGKENAQPVSNEALIMSGVITGRCRLYHLAMYKLNRSTLNDIYQQGYIGIVDKPEREIIKAAGF